jgi:hypothetical protein
MTQPPSLILTIKIVIDFLNTNKKNQKKALRKPTKNINKNKGDNCKQKLQITIERDSNCVVIM